jgi:hypothetical protein
MRLQQLLTFVITLALLTCGCSKPPAVSKSVVIPPTEIVTIGGGAITVTASTVPFTLKTQEILDSANNPIADGIAFVVKGDGNVAVSADGVTFSQTAEVTSVNSHVMFSVTAPTVAGTYKATVTQKVKQTTNATAFFYVDVKPASVFDLGSIGSDRFEDAAPFNGVKDGNEPFSILADGSSQAQISVGPIKDKFGNLLQDGYVRISPSIGQIVSQNPVQASAGYVYFYYLPTAAPGTVTFTAEAVDEQAGRVLKTVSGDIIQVKPSLSFDSTGNLGAATTSVAAQFKVTLTNSGTTAASAIGLKVTSPFSLPLTGECPLILRAGASCQFTIQINSPNRGVQTGILSLTALPSTIPAVNLTLPISVKLSAPASLNISTDSIGFGAVACGATSTQEFYVFNSGESDATNLQVQNPPPFSGQTVGYYSLILPAADAVAPADPNAVMNCGTTVPAGGRKCRVLVKYNPTALVSTQTVTGRIGADGIDSIPVSIIGSSAVGNPAGSVPISFNQASQNLSSTAQTSVTVGPVLDQCGNVVNSSTQWSASVTAGHLSQSSGTLVGGQATMSWFGSNSLSDLGPQIISVSSVGISSQQTLPFVGSDLRLSGSTDLGEISIGSPRSYSWTLTNNGNSPSTGILINFAALSNLTISNVTSPGCDALLAGASCTINATITPVISSGSSVSLGAKLVATGTGFGQLTPSLLLSGFGHQPIALNGTSTNYSLGSQRAGQPITRVLTIMNPLQTTVGSLSYNFVGPSANWIVSNITCTGSLNAGQACDLSVEFVGTQSGTSTAVLMVQNSSNNTAINLSVTTTPADPFGTFAVTPGNSSLPADNVSTTSLAVGPVRDQFGNVVQVGTPVYISTTKGTIVESQPQQTDASGSVSSTFKSTNSSTGSASITAKTIRADGSVSSSGSAAITLTGVFLSFAQASFDFGQVPMGTTSSMSIVLSNTGTLTANNINIASSNSGLFSIASLGTCSSGTIAAGSSCTFTVSFISPLAPSKSTKTATVTVSSSATAGQASISASVQAVSLLPATLVALEKIVSVELVPTQIYTTTISLTNIGDATVHNFAVSSTQSSVKLSDFGGCEGLISGATCTIVLTFNPNGSAAPVKALITATADNTSEQIQFITDVVTLAFSTSSFNADVLTCHPVQIQAQDTGGDPLHVQTTVILNLQVANGKSGLFYRSSGCGGTTVSRIGIFPGSTASELIYYKPVSAGTHLLQATTSVTNVSISQSDVANLVILPAKALTVAPRQTVFFTVEGAVNGVTCSLISNGSGGASLGNQGANICQYRAGPLGEAQDQFLIADADSPSNTATVTLNTTKALVISPLTQIVNSGGVLQFNAAFGSLDGYVYSIASATPRIGSSMTQSLYTAGQNVTGLSTYSETITVTDSVGATASTTLTVLPSLFNQGPSPVQQANGTKSFAVWADLMVVGAPNEAVGTYQAAGKVFIYKKVPLAPGGFQWNYVGQVTPYTQTPGVVYDNSNFGASVAIFNKHVVVGAPNETVHGFAHAGALYYLTLNSDGTVAESPRRILKDARGAAYFTKSAGDKFGSLIGMTYNYFVSATPTSLYVFNYSGNHLTTDGPQQDDGSICVAPCPSAVTLSAPISSLTIYNNKNYGGGYIAVGNPTANVGDAISAGSVTVYKNRVDESTGFDNWSGSKTTLPSGITNDLVTNDSFGTSVAMYGPYLAIGAPNKFHTGLQSNGTGQVYIFKRDALAEDNIWSQVRLINPKDYNPLISPGANFGSSLAIWGNYLAIGSPDEQNYSSPTPMTSSGSMYMFQRYLSDDNKWEYLGLLRGTNYGASDRFARQVVMYSNEYLASSENASGQIYYYTGKKSTNEWPFGYHDTLSVSGGFLHPSGMMRDWSGLQIPEGEKYSISTYGTDGQTIIGTAAWSSVGVAGDTIINGTLSATGAPYEFTGVITNPAQDVSGFDIGKTLTAVEPQMPGGAGGRDGQTGTWAYSTDASCGFCFDCNHGWLNPIGSIAQTDPTGFGATGRNGQEQTIDSDHSVPGGNGGGGGVPGQHGLNVFFNTRSPSIYGSGLIDFSGQPGNQGQAGTGESPQQHDCFQIEDCGDGCDHSHHTSYYQGGPGGGGGGGAGGNAGSLVIQTGNPTTTLLPTNLNYNPGPGGPGGGGGGGANGFDGGTGGQGQTGNPGTCVINGQACQSTIPSP